MDCAQAILLAVGIAILGGIAIHYAGGWGGFTGGLADIVQKDVSSGQNLTPDGYSMKVAIPGSIQMVSAGSKASGGAWTGIMCMTYMFALMGIQSSLLFPCGLFQIKPSGFSLAASCGFIYCCGYSVVYIHNFSGLGRPYSCGQRHLGKYQ